MDLKNKCPNSASNDHDCSQKKKWQAPDIVIRPANSAAAPCVHGEHVGNPHCS